MAMPTLSRFGERLRAWRKRRGLSQLDLALIAGTTSRYVSFVETGRSRPGRGVVLRLADAMSLSLRDSNALLVAAGLSPAYTEQPLDDAQMAPVRRVVDAVLRNHEPYPAWAIGPALKFLGSNAAAERIFPGMTQMSPEALVDMWCSPAMGEGWQESARQTVAALRTELLQRPHPDLPALLSRAEDHAKGLGPAPDSLDTRAMCSTMQIQGRAIRTLSTVMHFDHPSDVTMAEIRVELIFPADADAEAFFVELAQEA